MTKAVYTNKISDAKINTDPSGFCRLFVDVLGSPFPNLLKTAELQRRQRNRSLLLVRLLFRNNSTKHNTLDTCNYIEIVRLLQVISPETLDDAKVDDHLVSDFVECTKKLDAQVI